ncbi:MAG: magnesium transporter [Cellulomonadaceae bacterium]|jgi:magnesium transporter|nr:magnesium transporter [Cellulomonadaceae bacterium]
MNSQRIISLVDSPHVNELKDVLAASSDLEILDALYDLPAEKAAIAFRLLGKDQALRTFEDLNSDQQRSLMYGLTAERSQEFVNALAPDTRQRLFDEMPAAVAKRLIEGLTPDERAMTNILMGYERETAGRLMTPEFISLRKNQTVSSAMAKVKRQAADKETIYTLYVTDVAKKLEGVLSLRELLLAEDDALVGDIMHQGTVSVTTGCDQEEAAQQLRDLDMLALPVVDKEQRIVGILTVDDAIDILEEEATEDIYDSAGLADLTKTEESRSEVLVHGSLWSIWKVRLPFLFITVVAGMLAGAVMEGFEETLESVVAVALFIPLIMDMGGNVGTQSSTVFARGVVLGHIDTQHFLKAFLKETGVGFSLGVVVGIISGIIASVWQGMPALGLAVGLSLVAAMTMAAMLGFLVPFVLIKVGIDQAAGSAPIITSIKDIAGLAIYFGFVTMLLGHLL